ncbi:hypothetical protein pdam_00011286 [Pocillopora damicornis]|uniref:Sodium/potassium-transporting ATPase subunit beta-1-interacting protein n=1 Tax=Pocillopora damicornis TaxID=46731 RepID=A0A3M6TR97_POCDA|nr:hypothetical protein pdam_00011286 [Pocillopora damicornis]
MGCCGGRTILFFILVLQMLVVVERQVFDFLGFMWAPIIANFIHIAFLIIGIFGAYQYRSAYVITYSVWCLIWFGINLTIMSLYLEIDRLTHKDDWLSLKTGHQSWWAENGIGCETKSSTNDGTESPTDGCLLLFTYVESVQAAAECILAAVGSPGLLQMKMTILTSLVVLILILLTTHLQNHRECKCNQYICPLEKEVNFVEK